MSKKIDPARRKVETRGSNRVSFGDEISQNLRADNWQHIGSVATRVINTLSPETNLNKSTDWPGRRNV